MLMPAIIPEIAPCRFMRLEKIPIMRTGKIDEAASPKAMATVPAAKPGGFSPKYPATIIAPIMETRLAVSSCLSVISGLRMPFRRSCDTAEEMASSKPAAVDRAAASPPATTNAITHPGSLAISGLASTKKSLSGPFLASFSSFPNGMCTNSLPFQPSSDSADEANVLLVSL